MCFGFLFNIHFSFSRFGWFSTICYNGLRVAAVGDFGAPHCQPAQKFDSSTQLQFYTSLPIAATRCYSQWFFAFC